MKRMHNKGFTIVESLIVLAVSGVLLVSATTMIQGQQSKARFRSAMTDITSKIQSTINEAGSGYYPPNIPFTCTQVAGNVSISAVAAGQGTNRDCIYLGRAMMFGIQPVTDPQQYVIHTLVGLRASGGQEATTYAQTRLRAISPPSSPAAVDLSETKTLQYGTTVRFMRRAADSVPIVGVAFVIAPGQNGYNASGELRSGSAITTIVPIPGAGTPGLTKTNGVSQVANQFQLAVPPREGAAEICFSSGATNQSGLVTIGSGGGNSTVDLRIFSTPNCS
jgi:prepilin-type N-terminal cleavage/methylation domain-containing protein